jgi:hypothetical protein
LVSQLDHLSGSRLFLTTESSAVKPKKDDLDSDLLMMYLTSRAAMSRAPVTPMLNSITGFYLAVTIARMIAPRKVSQD